MAASDIPNSSTPNPKPVRKTNKNGARAPGAVGAVEQPASADHVTLEQNVGDLIAAQPLTVVAPGGSSSAKKIKKTRDPVEMAKAPAWLPEGFTMETRTRLSGATVGVIDKYYRTPDKSKKLRSKAEVFNYLDQLKSGFEAGPYESPASKKKRKSCSKTDDVPSESPAPANNKCHSSIKTDDGPSESSASKNKRKSSSKNDDGPSKSLASKNKRNSRIKIDDGGYKKLRSALTVVLKETAVAPHYKLRMSHEVIRQRWKFPLINTVAKLRFRNTFRNTTEVYTVAFKVKKEEVRLHGKGWKKFIDNHKLICDHRIKLTPLDIKKFEFEVSRSS